MIKSKWAVTGLLDNVKDVDFMSAVYDYTLYAAKMYIDQPEIYQTVGESFNVIKLVYQDCTSKDLHLLSTVGVTTVRAISMLKENETMFEDVHCSWTEFNPSEERQKFVAEKLKL